MKPSLPNEHGVLESGCREVVASRGRAYAAIKIAWREDGKYSFGLYMVYNYGGFNIPIWDNGETFATKAEARTAALAELLRHWHTPFPSEPQSVHDELRERREQVEAHVRQPSLF